VCCSVLCVEVLWEVCALQCVAFCCSLLQSFAVCCVEVLSEVCLLQSVAVYCSMLQSIAVCCSLLQSVAFCCSPLQHVAVYCSLLQCEAVFCKTLKILKCLLQSVIVCCVKYLLQCDVGRYMGASPQFQTNFHVSKRSPRHSKDRTGKLLDLEIQMF